ncbi:50S ribosomal protein L1 [Pedobacter sp.]|nr:50S ribosomal protein L1 [Candidatus Saccharibacteria bacterium]
MSKKLELLEEAKKLKLEVTAKNTIAEIEAAIAGADAPKKATKTDAAAEVETVKADKPLAKAGKRSEKAIKEVEAKEVKEARKEAGDTTPIDENGEAHAKKGPRPVTRPLLERRGKAYQAVAKELEANKTYSLVEAIALAVKTNPAKFDASVEAHIVLGVDPRQADQNVRATVSLPHGTGKTIRVAAFVPAEEVEAAKKAGADIAGEDEIVKLLDKAQIDFDILVSSPTMMPKLGRYARLLGPRGLMPNPKSGTVSTNVPAAVKEAKGGRVEYRVDKQAIVHLAFGKVSFGADKLADNAKVLFDSLLSVKPSSLKGAYITSIHLSTTMGPGIKVDTSSL